MEEKMIKGSKMSIKSRKKMSKSRLGKSPWNKGIKIDRKKYPEMGHFQKHTQKSRIKMGKSQLGRKQSKETIEKIRKAKKGIPRVNGKFKTTRGYIFVLSPNHPSVNSAGYVFEHRLVMEKHIGKYLKPSEQVHHINGNRSDNRIENLQLFANITEHMKFHNHKL
jgi:hypothetical protein